MEVRVEGCCCCGDGGRGKREGSTGVEWEAWWCAVARSGIAIIHLHTWVVHFSKYVKNGA
jgi:hypothetical protein